jgi:hypothetical protein
MFVTEAFTLNERKKRRMRKLGIEAEADYT